MNSIEKKRRIIKKLINPWHDFLFDRFSMNKKKEVSKTEIINLRKKHLKIIDNNHPISFYLHIPFCEKICKYCMYDKLLLTNQKQKKDYILDVKNFLYNFIDLFKKVEFSWIYVWWGTPSTLNESEMEDIFWYIFKNFKFNKDYQKTIELNPCSTSLSKIKKVKDLWFDRISFWVQSFNKNTLEKENRRYVDKETIKEFISYWKKVWIEFINTDLVLWLWDDDISDFISNLNILKECEPDSITYYTVMKEQNKTNNIYIKYWDKFYDNLENLFTKTIKGSKIKNKYNTTKLNNVLWYIFKHKKSWNSKKSFWLYSNEKKSIFGVWYKSISKVRNLWSYETSFFKNWKFIFSIEKLDNNYEILSYTLKSFQDKIDKIDFKKKFNKNIKDMFKEEIDFLIKNNIIIEDDRYLYYNWEEKNIWFYWLIFLSPKELLQIAKNRKEWIKS